MNRFTLSNDFISKGTRYHSWGAWKAAASRPHQTVLIFCCFISWIFLWLYLFSLKQDLFIIGGQMSFTIWYTCAVKIWIFFWGTPKLSRSCRNFWNVFPVSLYTICQVVSFSGAKHSYYWIVAKVRLYDYIKYKFFFRV